MSTSLGPADVVKSDLFFPSRAIFRVENTLYDIPKYALTDHSEVFAGMFLLDGGEEGTTVDNPILLDGYETIDFESLLKVVLPRPQVDAPNEFVELNKEEWIGVLKLSTIWQMNAIRVLAINELSEMGLTPKSKVELGRAYGVADWLREGATAIVEALRGEEVVSAMDDAGAIFGWETTARLLAERSSSKNGRGPSPTGNPYDISRLQCCRCCERYSEIRNGVPSCKQTSSNCHDGWFSVKSEGGAPPCYASLAGLKMVCGLCRTDYPEAQEDCSACLAWNCRTFVRVAESGDAWVTSTVEKFFGEEIRDLTP